MATASSTYPQNGSFAPSPAGAIDGEHRGSNYLTTGAWHSSTPTVPQWLQVDFNGSKTIDEISVFSLHDNYSNPPEPTEATTFSLHGLTAFDVQYWNGSSWVTVPGGSVTGNNKVWKKIAFSAITTSKIRVVINATSDGWSRVVELEAWSAQSVSGGSPSDFAMARLNPLNRTGTGGEDLLSNNFNWNLPLVGLKGRGLDLGLTLSYNSLVWIKAGNSINFDLDKGSIAPGFRLGFPTVEGPYFNSEANANFYLLITPSGGRIELRQVGTSIVYESKDSTYLQLVDNLNSTLTLRPPDGSQMNFIGVDGAWRCNQIKDRNGNFINATYESWGELKTVTDTLGRVLRFVYDTNDNLSCITQGWNGQPAPTNCEQSQPHVWATFGWGTAPIGNNFPGLNNYGPNSTTIPVLTQVGLPDGSRYNFEYSNTFGMVSTVRHYASDNHQRNYTTYVTPASATDCPRLTERRVWAEAWTGVNDVPAEVVTYFGHDTDNGCRMTLPDGTVHKEYYGSSWQSGLTTETRSYATVADANSNLWQKKTTKAWTQDNPSLSYQTNPRMIETNVYDSGGNRRRTTIDYSVAAYTQYGLPYFVTEYKADGVTELRRTYTDYNLNQAYLDRRIIGLVSAMHVTDASGFQAKVTYNYDTNAINLQATTATMHDQSYNSSLTVRGNVTSVSRWDVTDIDNASKALTVTATYNAAGSMISTTDPASHSSYVSYVDNFAGGLGGNTFAHPTTVTDADGFSSTVEYNFDFGAKTQIKGPPPQNQTQGIVQTFSYDEAMRLKRVTTVNTGAYVHYDYGPNHTSSFASVNAVAPNYWQSDSYTNRFFDGLGRVFAVASNHPNSTGGNRGQYTRYDQMGRAVQQTNPFEMNSGWNPTGDDATGYQFNVKNTFDWQGRPLKTHNMDATYKEASYSGCGCAGGEMVTLTDEMDRQQKVYSDVLGRQWKSEVLNWDGTVYSTTTNTFNARDQVTLVRQFAGTDQSQTYQDTTMSFDGYGRLKTKHVPEQQDSNGNPTYTTWTYKPDDTVETVTDARGASATYIYNNGRHLVNEIHYSAPGGITPTSNVTFGYDAAGNRTSMTDGLGVVSYAYNQLSQMTSETRTFTDPQNPAINGGSKTISYGEYNPAGQLKNITDPFNAAINYGYDAAGRLLAVTGTSFAGVDSYATGVHYRAWGAVKNLSFGNGRTMSASYNSRMQVAGTSGVIFKNYQYFDDGKLRYSQDVVDDRFDRSYAYDHSSRVETALSGPAARGEADVDNRPYQQTLSYDAFNHLTSQTGKHWSSTSASYSGTFADNRRADANYDADGNLLNAGSIYTYNSAAQIAVVQSGNDSTTQGFDGDGLRVKTSETTVTNGQPSTEVRYYVRSTVLGGKVVTELNAGGGKQRTFVYAAGQVWAWQRILSGVPRVTWEHRDPSNASFRTTNEDGTMNGQTYTGDGAPAELDPTGANADVLDPYLFEPPPEENQGSLISHGSFGDVAQLGTTYSLDGIPMPADELFQMMNTLLHGQFGMLDGLARASLNDRNYQRRWVGHPLDGKWETTALSKSSPWTSAGGLGSLFDEPQNPAPTTSGRQRDFYNQYQQKLAHCIWRIFSRDYQGKATAVDGAALLGHQTPSNAPAIDTSRTTASMPGRALGSVSSGDLERGKFGTINMASDIGPMMNKKTGVMMTTAEVWNRTYAHELGNLLGGRIAGSLSGSATLFGDPRGIENAAGNYWDTDPGARLETCMFGGVAP